MVECETRTQGARIAALFARPRTQDRADQRGRAVRASFRCEFLERVRVRASARQPLVAEPAHGVDDRQERLALLREGVLDPRRRLWVALPLEDPVGLERAQPLGERARADALARTLELREAARAFGEIVDEQRRPLRADDLGGRCDRAG